MTGLTVGGLMSAAKRKAPFVIHGCTFPGGWAARVTRIAVQGETGPLVARICGPIVVIQVTSRALR
jgi:hypothetical protein